MTYQLGVDIGVSRVHAAMARTSEDGSVTVEPFQLGSTGPDLPALVALSPEGEWHFGDQAAAIGSSRPQNLLTGLRRRIGDDVPFVVDGHKILAEDAYARLAVTVIEFVAQSEGARPAHVTLTYPADWGFFRVTLVQDALGTRYSGAFELIPEAEAAARGTTHTVDKNKALAVYDLGATTFDTAILRRKPIPWSDFDAWTILDETTGIPIGGMNFDDAIVRHVISSLDSAEEISGASLVALRGECAGAKEVLSLETRVEIPVRGADGPTNVPVSRTEFESLIESSLDTTISTLSKMIDGAELAAQSIDAVLLVGGSALIPYVQERLSEELEFPIVTQGAESLIALGAARSSWERSVDLPPPPPEPEVEEEPEEKSRFKVEIPKLVLSATDGSSRVATYMWRGILAVLFVASALYLFWALSPDSPGLFGSPAETTAPAATPTPTPTPSAEPTEPTSSVVPGEEGADPGQEPGPIQTAPAGEGDPAEEAPADESEQGG